MVVLPLHDTLGKDETIPQISTLDVWLLCTDIMHLFILCIASELLYLVLEQGPLSKLVQKVLIIFDPVARLSPVSLHQSLLPVDSLEKLLCPSGLSPVRMLHYYSSCGFVLKNRSECRVRISQDFFFSFTVLPFFYTRLSK